MSNSRGHISHVRIQKKASGTSSSPEASIKTAKTKLTKKRKLTIKKLKKKKTYYIRVRAYRLDGKGKKIFGPYSKNW